MPIAGRCFFVPNGWSPSGRSTPRSFWRSARAGSGAGIAVDDPTAGYAEPSERPPLLWYGVLMSVFGSLVGAAGAAAKSSGRELPERLGAADLLTVGVASHKVA